MGRSKSIGGEHLLNNFNRKKKYGIQSRIPCPFSCCYKVFSREYSHKDFCLAHLFTDLKFEGGILGLAYVGSPRRNSVGGICTPGLTFFHSVYVLMP